VRENMSSGEFAAEQEMRCLKLDAFENGLQTDFSFLLGPDKRPGRGKFQVLSQSEVIIFITFNI